MSTLKEILSITVPLVDLSKRTQVLWIDNARITACFFALFVHVSAGVVVGIEDTGSLYWWVGNIFNSCARWALPVFVMISGALLLDKAADESIFVFYRRRFSRIFVPLVFWTVFFSLFHYFGKLVVDGERLSAWSLFSSALYGYPYYHLWYLYMVIGLYFMVPFLARMIRQSSIMELMILCLALFVFSMLGNIYISYYTVGQIPAVFTFICYLPYFLAGYLIARTDFSPPNWVLWTVFILSGIINSVGNYDSLSAGGTAGGYFNNCLNITIVPMSLGIMFLLKKFNVPVIKASVSSRLALLSLGIYVIHPVFIEIFKYSGIAAKYFNPIFSIPLMSALFFVISVAASFIIGKIPGFNRIIGLR